MNVRVGLKKAEHRRIDAFELWRKRSVFIPIPKRGNAKECSNYLLRGRWDLPGPGFEPVSPALAGGFFTTEPPG